MFLIAFAIVRAHARAGHRDGRSFSLGLSLVNATIPALLSPNAPDNLRSTVLGAASSLEKRQRRVHPGAHDLRAAIDRRYGNRRDPVRLDRNRAIDGDRGAGNGAGSRLVV
jgi:hypothetical protein